MVSLLMHIYASLGLNELKHWKWNKSDDQIRVSCIYGPVAPFTNMV